MTTYKIEIDGQRAVDLVTALRRAGLDDLAADIDRQIQNQRAQAVRTLWMQGRRNQARAQKVKGSTNFLSLFSGVGYERQSAI